MSLLESLPSYPHAKHAARQMLRISYEMVVADLRAFRADIGNARSADVVLATQAVDDLVMLDSVIELLDGLARRVHA